MVKVKVKQEISNKWKYFFLIVGFVIMIAILNIGTGKISEVFKSTNSISNNNSSQSEQEAVEKEKQSNNTNSSSSTYSSSTSSKICSWCGKAFSGEHYTHLGKMSDCYRTDSSSSIGIYCSSKCCSEARKSSCPTCH